MVTPGEEENTTSPNLSAMFCLEFTWLVVSGMRELDIFRILPRRVGFTDHQVAGIAPGEGREGALVLRETAEEDRN